MTLPLVFGVDGGQTSTKCALATIDGRVLAWGRGGPLIHLAAAGGPEQFVQSLRAALADAWANAGLTPGPVEAIGLGLTGVEAGGEGADVATRLIPTVVEARQVDAQNDGVAALVGAHLDQPGVIVIAGTGSISLGRDRHGALERVGGWGWLLGDEGSALALGRDGLIAALHAADGLGPGTWLTEAFLTHFGVDHPRAIKPLVYASDFGARGFAALAPVVSRVAEDGDAVAREVIQRGGVDLTRAALTLVQRLDFGAAPVPIAPVGGAFEHVWSLRDIFAKAVQAERPQAVVREPLLPPALGAALLALKLCGVAPLSVYPALREGLVYADSPPGQ